MYDQWKVMEDLRAEFRVVADPNEQDRLPMIPLKADRGHVYVHGPNELGAVVRYGRVPTFARKLKAEFPSVDVMEGEGELLVTWQKSASWCIELLDRLGARRRMRLSVEERERRRERGLKYRANLRQKTPVLASESHGRKNSARSTPGIGIKG